MTSDQRTPPEKGPASLERRSGRLAKFAIYLVVLIAIGIGGFAAFAYRPSIPEGPTPDAASFSTTLVEQGGRLAAAGFCASCHTVVGGKPFAGGYAMKSDFGTIYSTNISPDRTSGIGAWSEEAFHRAMREGVARDGSHLFPAFPYDHFTRLSDADIHALYAFIMTRAPEQMPNHPNEMIFPFGIRSLQAGWKLLYFHPDRFIPETDKSALWNRGAYLAESLSHCSACHTPRGPLGEELTNRLYQGASVDGWFAPALTAANPSPAPWTTDELQRYLTTGISKYHGTAAGPMATVSRELGDVAPEDQHALVTYIASLGSGDSKTAKIAPAVTAALAADAQDHARIRDAGGRLFVAACASCHYNSAPDVNPNRPELGLNTAVYLDDPSNLIHVILNGINAKDGAPGIVMPGFARGMTDADVTLLANYLRATRTDKAPWPNLEKQVAKIRAADLGDK
jgi:mono/diheme cytochrome c family protein